MKEINYLDIKKISKSIEETTIISIEDDENMILSQKKMVVTTHYLKLTTI